MLFFRYFPPKNCSIEQLFNDFLKKTSEKIAIPYKHFLKKDKSNKKRTPFALSNDKKISLRFSNDFFFQWVENLWKKESIEKQKCTSYFFVSTKHEFHFWRFFHENL